MAPCKRERMRAPEVHRQRHRFAQAQRLLVGTMEVVEEQLVGCEWGVQGGCVQSQGLPAASNSIRPSLAALPSSLPRFSPLTRLLDPSSKRVRCPPACLTGTASFTACSYLTAEALTATQLAAWIGRAGGRAASETGPSRVGGRYADGSAAGGGSS